MNCLSLNVQGLGDLNKRRWINGLCNLHKVNFLGVQETKLTQVDLWMVCQVWGNTHFDFASSSARGLSGVFFVFGTLWCLVSITFFVVIIMWWLMVFGFLVIFN